MNWNRGILTDGIPLLFRDLSTDWKAVNIRALFLAFAIPFLLSGCGDTDKKPPVSMTYRYSRLDSTKVLQVTNRDGSETLVMHLHVKNKEKGESANHTFKVRPGDTYEIGRLELNWVFEKGEEITIEADGYSKSLTDTVP